MKKTLEELQETYKNIIGDNTSDEALSFLEDITDSFSKPDVDWKAKYEQNDAEWRQKYRDRFFSAVPDEDEKDYESEKPAIKTKFEELFKED